MTAKMKLGCILSLIIGVGIFNSCTEMFVTKQKPEMYVSKKVEMTRLPDTKYGTYLAGRVAHIRQNYDVAADYYMKSLNLGLDNKEVLSSTYLLLASSGRIDEASEYAVKAREQGDKANLIAFILMAHEMKQNNYQGAFDSLSSMEDTALNTAVIPLFEAWILAGSGKKEESLKKMDVLTSDASLMPLYHMHKGMLLDYFEDDEGAFNAFEQIVNDEKMPLSFRSLEIIGNFYVRTGRKDKILSTVDKYYKQNNSVPMLQDLKDSLEKSDPSQTQKMIDTPIKGLAEAVFNIGTLFRGVQNEVAQLFTSLVLYLNPDFEVARVAMADLYEQAHRYDKAVKEYLKIDSSSPAYFVARLKASENYSLRHQYKKASDLLTDLLNVYPNNEQITFRLGELYRIMKQYDKAVTYYLKTLDALPKSEKDRWTIYYALGISYERQNKWNEAENMFQQALKASNRHPYVLNYLGYSWLEQNMNCNEALYMIFEAHRKDPTNGHIIDSVGWALYKMGKYQEAVKVLERASEYLPSNAVVFNHLGDAYWQSGRKDEARYQWQHALKASEDKEDINEDEIAHKIEKGLLNVTSVSFNEELLNERLKAFDNDTK